MLSNRHRLMLSPGHRQHEQRQTNPITPEQVQSLTANRPPQHQAPLRRRSSITDLAEKAVEDRYLPEKQPCLVPMKDLLFRKLQDMPARLSTSSPVVNAAAKREQLHELELISVKYDAASEIKSRLLKREHFLRFVESPAAPPVPWFPQSIRLNAREADAGASFLSNVLNPAVAILQQLIEPRYQGIIKVVLSSQYEAHDDDKVEGASASKADEAIALIRWPPDKEGKVLYKKILLFVEMKRPGYIRAQDWGRNLSLYARKLLPQVLLYTRNFKNEDYIFSDYYTSIAIKVNLSDMGLGEDVHVGALDCDGLVDKAHSGPMVAIVWAAACSLKKLGILRCEIEGTNPDKQHIEEELQSFLGPHRMITGKAPNPDQNTPVLSRDEDNFGTVESPAHTRFQKLQIDPKDRRYPSRPGSRSGSAPTSRPGSRQGPNTRFSSRPGSRAGAGPSNEDAQGA